MGIVLLLRSHLVRGKSLLQARVDRFICNLLMGRALAWLHCMDGSDVVSKAATERRRFPNSYFRRHSAASVSRSLAAVALRT